MKQIKTFFVLVFITFTTSIFCQETDAPLRCETPSRENYFSNNPKAYIEAKKLEDFTKKFIEEKKKETKNASGNLVNRSSKYVIPIVFHIFGTDFVGKQVDDALVKDALKKTNEDFNGLNNDFNDVSNQFKPLRSTLDIEFRLAEIDPNGNPTTGINYYTNRAGFGADNIYDEEIAKFAWDNYKYFNVYILLDLKKDGKLNRSGVAWYPNKDQSDRNVARAVFNGRYLGTNSNENFRRILTHEFAHYLNLAHTFEGGCSGTGDNVNDTPATTVSLECLVTQEKCPGAGIPNSENFMDYTDCYRMFTIGQVQRMQAALEFSTRKPLWQTSNHVNVFSQNSNEPKLYYDFTTFTESFENNGAIGGNREVKIRLENGPKFSTIGTLSNSAFTVENLPQGLSVQIISSTATEATVKLLVNAGNHSKENDIRNLKLTFNNTAFLGFNATSIKGYSKPDLRIEFNNPYESSYQTFDELRQVSVDGNSFISFGINPEEQRPRYELSIDNERIMFGFDAGTKHVAVNANKQVLLIEEGTNIGSNLNWDHNDLDRVLVDDSYQVWKGKRGFVGLRIERAEFPGKYYYGWARVEVSSDGKIAQFIDYFSHKNPDVQVKAGVSDKPVIALSKPTFFEQETNTGTFAEEIDVILEGSAAFTNQNLIEGIHYTASNLPAGLSVDIQKINSQLAKLKLVGTASSHVKGDGKLVKLQFNQSAFSIVPTNRTSFNVQIRFFDPYGITYINTAGLLPWINSGLNNRWVYVDTDFDFGDNSRYAVTHFVSNSDGKEYVSFNGRGKGFTMDATTFHPESLNVGSQVGVSNNFVSTGYGVNRAPRLAGFNVPHNGNTVYTGLRFRDRAGRLHYGWVKYESKNGATEARILAIAFNRTPNASITVGETPNDYCYAAANINEKYDNYSNSIGEFNFEQFTQVSDFPENYTDFSSKLIKVRPGKNTFSIKNGGIRTSETDRVGLWIDLNNDKDFADSGEQIHISQAIPAGSEYASEVDLPNVDGTYRLRIIVKNETEADNPQPSPCDFFLHGEVEDYTINISNANPIHPIAKFDMVESISAKGLLQVTDTSLKEPDTWNWTFEGGVPSSFNGKEPPAIYYENEGTFKVSLTVKRGEISDSYEEELIVTPHPTNYCSATRRGNHTNRGDITKVVFGDINNSTETGGSGYGDFTSLSTGLVEGQTYPIEITTFKQLVVSATAGTNLVVWIDWNRNNEFSEDEIAFERKALSSDTDTFIATGNITVPRIYSNGNSRMRVIRYYSFDENDKPRCGEIAEADIEDYTVSLSGVVVTPPVANFEADKTIINEGNSVSFTDTSTNQPTTWNWVFEGGTPSTSTNQNPSIVYNTPGTYKVTLTAGNLGGNNSIVKENFITVNPSSTVTYCESSGARVQYEWIAGVKVGDFENNSTGSLYSDYTNQVIPLVKETATSITLTPGHSGSAYNEYFKVWIDYNQDGVFDANEVAFDAGSASNTAVNGTITVPSGALLGTTRMRVSMKYNTSPDACGSIGDGEVEDYTVNILNNTNPNPITYCEASGTRVQYEWIAGVKVGDFENNSTGALYSDYTNQVIPLVKETATSITLTPGHSGSAYNEYFKVWIDYNQDGVFDANEVAFDAGSASNTAVNGTITVPNEASLGSTRMRVSMKYNSSPNACGSIGDGEVEDYTVNISNTIVQKDVFKETLKKDNTTIIYPNPVKTGFTLYLGSKYVIKKKNIKLSVFDVTGKLLNEVKNPTSKKVNFNIASFKTGVYLIKIEQGQIKEYRMFIKE
ncbi:GEVED domain-containing protein [uncultured Tenacibaculum sp.]|uniref:GEVED domain-containing protein n=1 Tax=uncultured Tenacibaculum sp. TaxID=174713 RepID=UPI00263665A9|nr:GEVED domain-containing protein [uncultured Tenacibaculum sp.]